MAHEGEGTCIGGQRTLRVNLSMKLCLGEPPIFMHIYMNEARQERCLPSALEFRLFELFESNDVPGRSFKAPCCKLSLCEINADST